MRRVPCKEKKALGTFLYAIFFLKKESKAKMREAAHPCLFSLCTPPLTGKKSHGKEPGVKKSGSWQPWWQLPCWLLMQTLRSQVGGWKLVSFPFGLFCWCHSITNSLNVPFGTKDWGPLCIPFEEERNVKYKTAVSGGFQAEVFLHL